MLLGDRQDDQLSDPDERVAPLGRPRTTVATAARAGARLLVLVALAVVAVNGVAAIGARAGGSRPAPRAPAPAPAAADDEVRAFAVGAARALLQWAPGAR